MLAEMGVFHCSNGQECWPRLYLCTHTSLHVHAPYILWALLHKSGCDNDDLLLCKIAFLDEWYKPKITGHTYVCVSGARDKKKRFTSTESTFATVSFITFASICHRFLCHKALIVGFWACLSAIVVLHICSPDFKQDGMSCPVVFVRDSDRRPAEWKHSSDSSEAGRTGPTVLTFTHKLSLLRFQMWTLF